MKTSRDCVENFWLLHFKNFNKENTSIREYCSRHQLKPSSFCDWTKKLKPKHPNLFKIEENEDLSLNPETGLKDNNLFYEIVTDQRRDTVSTNKVFSKEIEITLKIENLSFKFSTYPQIDWVANLIKALR